MVANDVVYSTSSRLARELISINYITKRTARTARALAHSIVRSGSGMLGQIESGMSPLSVSVPSFYHPLVQIHVPL